MEKTFLFPHWCQKVGLWIIIVSVVLGIILALAEDVRIPIAFPDWVKYPVCSVPFLFSFAWLLLCLSQEKQEDEYIAHIRARSIFIVIIYAFVVGIFDTPIKFVGYRLFPISQLGNFLIYEQWFSNTYILALIYLTIFKGTLFVNWLKTRNNDGQ